MDNGLYQVTRFNLEAFAAPLEKLLTDENQQNTASIVDDIFIRSGD